MHKLNALRAFEKTANHWAEDLMNYEESELYLSPAVNEWCLAELYDHIMRVGRTYQLPNFHRCLNNDIVKGKPKNIKAYIIFDLNILPYRKIKMQSFPPEIVTNFTPQKRKKQALIEDFNVFIEEVKDAWKLLENFDKNKKHYHPFFGMINAKEWYALVEIHMRHHIPQKKRLEKLFHA